MSEPLRRSSATLWGAVLIGGLVVGMMGLRVHTALERGVFQFDEAYYLLEAKTFCRAMQEAPNLISGRLSLSDFKKRQMAEGTLFPPGKATPIYVFLIIPFALLPVAFASAGNLVSAAATLPAAGALYLCACALGLQRKESALLGVLYFVSPVISYYGVSTLPHALAAMFFLFSLWATLRGEVLKAGLLLGVTLGTHYGMMPSVLLCLAWLIFDILLRAVPLREKGIEVGRLTLGFWSPLLILEAGFQAVKWKFAAYWTDMTFRAYFSQFFRMVQANTPHDSAFSVSVLKRNLHVFESFATTQGLETSLLMGIALAVLGVNLRGVDRRTRHLLFFNAILLLFWILDPGYIASRVVMFILPGLFLALAAGLVLWQRKYPLHAPAQRVLLVLLIACSLLRSWPMSRLLRSPYPQAKDYLTATGYQGPVVDPSNVMVWQFYLGQRVDFEKGYWISFPLIKKHIFKLLDAPNAPKQVPFFYITQWDWALFGPGMEAFRDKLAARPPVRTWPLPYARLDLYHYEDYYAGPPKDEVLQLYWVSKKDFEGLPY